MGKLLLTTYGLYSDFVSPLMATFFVPGSNPEGLGARRHGESLDSSGFNSYSVMTDSSEEN